VQIDLTAIWAGDRQAIRLAMGELSAQEMRSVLALLNLLRQEREDTRQQLRLYALDLLSVHEQDWGLHDDPTEVRFRKRIKQLEAQVETLMKEIKELKGNDADTRIGARGSDFFDTSGARGAVGPGAPNYPEQQSDRPADENNVGARGAS
jgi:hypothetical protein